MDNSPLTVSDDDLDNLEYVEEEVIEDENEEPVEESDDETEELEEVDELEGEEEEKEEESDEGVEDKETDLEDEEQEGDTQTESDSKDPTLDYASEGKRIFQPFKANGKEIKVANAEDAITLMQKGANYNLKMAAIKPNLKMMRMLEKNGLLDEDNINRLIDLSKKEPEAIAQLVKDSGVDPFELDTDKDTEYTPNTYNVSDNEMALKEVLDDLESSASGVEVLDIVGNKWDEKSMQSLTQNPSDLLKLREQVEAGVFGRVQDVIENEKVMGRLGGLSDLEAYQTVGSQMLKDGQFKNIGNGIKASPQKVSAKRSNNIARKKAAGTTKSTPKRSENQPFDPLAVSDEEFEKLMGSQYF